MKKGQAALEFLTTYGWAFLVILVMIAALAYFGVLNPQKYLPEKCVITTGLDCTDQLISATAVRFKVTNNMGSTLTAFSASIKNGATYVSCTSAPAPPLISGDVIEFTCTTASTLGVGNKVKYPINVTYTKAGSTYAKGAYGEIFATIN